MLGKRGRTHASYGGDHEDVGVAHLLVILVAAASAQPKTKTYQTGTILSVQKEEANGVSYGKTDAPLRSTAFAYDVSVQVGDTVLVGRYQSALDYLPSTWTEGNSVEASLDKHRMYLKGSSAEDFELRVVSRRPLRKGK
jgi:hypothetical protein